MKYDIFSVGDNVADYYRAEKKVYAGGGAYNVAVMAKRMNKKTAYFGTFGTDENAKFLFDNLKKSSVAYPLTDIKKGRNAVSIVEKENGKSQIKGVDKGVYKKLDINDVQLKIIANSKVVHTTAYSYFEDYIKKLRFKTKISFDFSYIRKKEYLKELLRRVNFAFFSEAKDSENEEEFVEWASEQGAEVVILTRGKNEVLMKYDNKLITREVPEVDVTDDLGTGDAFIAGFLSSAVEGKPYEQCLDKAVETAAKYCRVKGSLGVSKPVDKEIILFQNVHADE
ncbi:MAG: PfkB family carbohydrate kinase [Bacillota bacterium]